MWAEREACGLDVGGQREVVVHVGEAGVMKSRTESALVKTRQGA